MALNVVTREVWVSGFVEGASEYLALNRTSPPDINGAINRYCAANPAKALVDAAEALIGGLKVGEAADEQARAANDYFRSSCGKWLADQKDGNTLLSLTGNSWLTGFVSAAGYYSGALKHTDVDLMDAWTNRYCSTHPLETLHEASTMLVRELVGQ